MTEPESIEPPVRLEERVVATLKAEGLLGGRRSRRPPLRAPWAWPAAIAAALLLFAAGYAAGRRPAAGPPAGLRQYTLLLYEGPTFNAGGVAEPALVREYSEWAAGLAGRGRLVTGEKLAENGWTLGAERAGASDGPAGFFVIAARGDDEALAIARTCPHLRHGGTVSLRPIEPT